MNVTIIFYFPDPIKVRYKQREDSKFIAEADGRK